MEEGTTPNSFCHACTERVASTGRRGTEVMHGAAASSAMRAARAAGSQQKAIWSVTVGVLPLHCVLPWQYATMDGWMDGARCARDCRPPHQSYPLRDIESRPSDRIGHLPYKAVCQRSADWVPAASNGAGGPQSQSSRHARGPLNVVLPNFSAAHDLPAGTSPGIFPPPPARPICR